MFGRRSRWPAATGLNIAGLAVVAALLYLVLILVISSVVEGRRKGVDRLVTGVVAAAFLLAMVPLVSVAWTVVANGIAGLSAEFLTSSMRNVVGEGGGALHAIVGTLLITLAAAIISIPIGLFTAIYLVEYGQDRKLARGITFLVDVMTGIPSIVAGLFAYALFAIFFGPGIRHRHHGLGRAGRADDPRRRALQRGDAPPRAERAARGLLRARRAEVAHDRRRSCCPPRSPASRPASCCRSPASSARPRRCCITAGVTASMNYNLFEGRMMTLPVFAYSQYMNQGIPAQAYIDRAWAAAFILIVIVMVLNLVARLVAKVFAPKTGR